MRCTHTKQDCLMLHRKFRIRKKWCKDYQKQVEWLGNLLRVDEEIHFKLLDVLAASTEEKKNEQVGGN